MRFGTNEIVELFPAPVDPTQMTQARGKVRSLTSISYISIIVILNIFIPTCQYLIFHAYLIIHAYPLTVSQQSLWITIRAKHNTSNLGFLGRANPRQNCQKL